MTRLKRLCIDWLWPDRTTFITKGRRWGIAYLVLAALSVFMLLPPTLYVFHLVKSEAKPRLELMIQNLDSAARATNESTAVEIQNARDWIHESVSLLDYFCYLLLFVICVLACWAAACGVLLLRAHHAFKSEP